MKTRNVEERRVHANNDRERLEKRMKERQNKRRKEISDEEDSFLLLEEMKKERQTNSTQEENASWSHTGDLTSIFLMVHFCHAVRNFKVSETEGGTLSMLLSLLWLLEDESPPRRRRDMETRREVLGIVINIDNFSSRRSHSRNMLKRRAFDGDECGIRRVEWILEDS